MLREFIHTSFGLVAAGEYRLLREYFTLIQLILAKPEEPTNQRLAFKAVVKPKENYHG